MIIKGVKLFLYYELVFWFLFTFNRKMILIILIIFTLVWYNRVLRKNSYNFIEQLPRNKQKENV